MSNLGQVQKYMANETIKDRFIDALGDRAGTFMASVINAVSNNKSLSTCDPATILGASFVAAAVDLPIDQNLGFAAIVPYKNVAQFQMMYKGFVQLAIRSAQYKKIHATSIYEDEISIYDPVTDTIFFTEHGARKQRTEGKTDKIIGYYSSFSLLNGFEKGLYMTVEEIRAHAKKYSASYRYDLQKKAKSSKWSTDFEPMALKTVLKLLLSKWGLLSIQMQTVLKADQRVTVLSSQGEIESTDYVDNKQNNTVPTSSSKSNNTESGSSLDLEIGEGDIVDTEESSSAKFEIVEDKPATIWDFEGDPESKISKEKINGIRKIFEEHTISFNEMLPTLGIGKDTNIKNKDLKSIYEYLNEA